MIPQKARAPRPEHGRRGETRAQSMAAGGGAVILLLSLVGLAALIGLDMQTSQTVDAPMLVRLFASEVAVLPLCVAGVFGRALEPSVTGIVQLAVMVVMGVVSVRAARFGLAYLGEGAYLAALASLAVPALMLILLTVII